MDFSRPLTKMEASFYTGSFSGNLPRGESWRSHPHNRSVHDLVEIFPRTNYTNEFHGIPTQDAFGSSMFNSREIPPLKLEREHQLSNQHKVSSESLLSLKYSNHVTSQVQPIPYEHAQEEQAHDNISQTSSSTQEPSDEQEQIVHSEPGNEHPAQPIHEHNPGVQYSPIHTYPHYPTQHNTYSNTHHFTNTQDGHNPSSGLFPSMSVNVSMSMNVHGVTNHHAAPSTLLANHAVNAQSITSQYENGEHWIPRFGGNGQQLSSAGNYYTTTPSSEFFHHQHHGNFHCHSPFAPSHGYSYENEQKWERDVYSNYKSNTTDSVSRLYALGALNPRRNRVTSFESVSGKVNLCRVCGKTYARPSTLKTHMRTHSGEKPYKCQTCNKSFSQAANLTAHVRTHSGEKPFRCPVCDRRFSQSSSVTTHMRTHSGERPYRCRLCKKAFSDSSTLTKHLRIHSGEKPYQCKLCLLRFSQSGNLNRHMRVHTNQQ